MKKIFTPVIVGTIFIFSGCSKSTEQKLIGKWKENSERQTEVEFCSDGTVNMNIEALQKIDFTATWTLLNESNLLINSSTKLEDNKSVTNLISFTEDRLLVTDIMNNVTVEYTRIK